MSELTFHQARAKSLTAAMAATTSSKLKAAWKADLDATNARIAELTAAPAPTPAPTPAPAPTPTPAPAPSGAWTDQAGVCTRLSANWPNVKTLLGNLGVKKIRDAWGIGWPGVPDPCDAILADLHTSFGIKITFPIDPREGGDIAARVTHAAKLAGQGLVDAFEMPNEWDAARFNVNGWTVTDSNWAAQLHSWCSQVIAALKANPATANIPILAPPLANTMNTALYTQVGLIPGLDFGNTHDYPGDQLQMTDAIATTALANARIIAGAGKPVICTETGFTTIAGDYPAVTEQQQADLTVALLQKHVADGIHRTFIYNLAPVNGDWRNGHALIRPDSSLKPVYSAVKALLAGLSRVSPTYS